MSATVQIDEANGVSQTVTANITNTNMGSSDAVNLDPTANPITPGQRTFVKYQKFHVTAMGGSSSIGNLKVWRTGSLGVGGTQTHLTNARTTSYGGALGYATPTQSSVTNVDQTMPTSEPASANVGIGGSLAGTLTGAGSSDYVAHQITSDASATAGSTSTMNYGYDETA